LVREENKKEALGFLPEEKIAQAEQELNEFPQIDVDCFLSLYRL
jgi:hypothetical protein